MVGYNHWTLDANCQLKILFSGTNNTNMTAETAIDIDNWTLVTEKIQTYIIMKVRKART